MSMKAAGKAARAKPAGVLAKLLTADNKLFMPASNDVSKKTDAEVCVPSVHKTEDSYKRACFALVFLYCELRLFIFASSLYIT